MRAPEIPNSGKRMCKDYGDMRAAWAFDIHTGRTWVRFDSIIGDQLLVVTFRQKKALNESRLNFFAKRARRVLLAAEKSGAQWQNSTRCPRRVRR